MRRVLYTKPLWSGFFKVVNATLLMGSGKAVKRDVVVNRDSAAILLVNTDRHTALMVKQYRPGPMLHKYEHPLYEIPAGVIEEGSYPRATGLREAMEEAGVVPYFLEKIGEAYLAPGTSTEVCHLFVGYWKDADKTGLGGGLASEGEEIELEEISLRELDGPLNALLRDMKTVAAIFKLKSISPNFFKPPVRD